MTELSGAARRINVDDIRDAAEKIGCELPALRAVIEVESRRSGFDGKRRPVILFEPHVFYRALSIRKGNQLLATPKRDRAIAAGLAYPRWGEKPYPKSSDGNYARLVAAIEIDEEAAFESVSIGLGQVLGENYKLAGFPSAKQMFDAARESEGVQLEQMVNFIAAKHLGDELQRRDWKGFATVYNGKGQVEKYAGELADAYAKWKRIDVPREAVTAHELRLAGSRTIAGADQVKSAIAPVATTAATVGAVAGQVSDLTGQISDAASTATDALHSTAGAISWAHGHWQALLFVGAASALAYFAWRIWHGAETSARARVDDERSGAHAGI